MRVFSFCGNGNGLARNGDSNTLFYFFCSNGIGSWLQLDGIPSFLRRNELWRVGSECDVGLLDGLERNPMIDFSFQRRGRSKGCNGYEKEQKRNTELKGKWVHSSMRLMRLIFLLALFL